MMEKKNLCPVCGKYVFEDRDIYDICDICNWCDDPIQQDDHDYKGGANHMSLNQAREAYKQGIQIR